MNLLDRLNNIDDIKKLNNDEINILSDEIRAFLIKNVSETGGHLASNLGVVELTVALMRVFNFNKDKIVFDVGHQSYVYKILTSRRDKFHTLRQFSGIAGFPKITESKYDFYNTGHSSTSISAALGLRRGMDLKKDPSKVIVVVGDGALTGGMAFEGLNDLGRSNKDVLVILNDNEMSISTNVGSISKYLSKIRILPSYIKTKSSIENLLIKIPYIGVHIKNFIVKIKDSIRYILVPGAFFEELGFTYAGPVDGHDTKKLEDTLKKVSEISQPVLLHVITKKGKGYEYAEKHPEKFHGISSFDIETGEKKHHYETFSDIAGKALIKLAEQDEKIVAITAAMPEGTGLSNFAKKFPHRFFDVAIAEQHAVSVAAGLSLEGYIPFYCVYSSFLQRAYDQIITDIAAMNLHAVMLIDRAGIVGDDGETHQGIFDISYLSHIPNLTILSAANFNELEKMIAFSAHEINSPVAIRYARGTQKCDFDFGKVLFQKGVVVQEGKDLTVIAEGRMLGIAVELQKLCAAKNISLEIINPRFLKPLDNDLILKSALKTKRVLTMEDGIISGGFGMHVLRLLSNEKDIKVLLKGFDDCFVEHGSCEILFDKYGLSAEKVFNEIKEVFHL